MVQRLATQLVRCVQRGPTKRERIPLQILLVRMKRKRRPSVMKASPFDVVKIIFTNLKKFEPDLFSIVHFIKRDHIVLQHMLPYKDRTELIKSVFCRKNSSGMQFNTSDSKENWIKSILHCLGHLISGKVQERGLLIACRGWSYTWAR